MPHQPGHDPAQEKVVVCNPLALSAVADAMELARGLHQPIPGGRIMLELLAEKMTDREMARLGAVMAAFCEAGEHFQAFVRPLFQRAIPENTDRQ